MFKTGLEPVLKKCLPLLKVAQTTFWFQFFLISCQICYKSSNLAALKWRYKLQWGSENWACPDFDWLKTGWLWNGIKKPNTIQELNI